MTGKLKETDRQAVDLVLDRFSMMGRDDRIIAVAGAPAEPHVQSVEKILNTLAQMPVPEPAADLIDRTLARIAAAGPVAEPPPMPFIDPNQLPA